MPGKVLLRVQYLSLDPYMRGWMDDRKPYANPLTLGALWPGDIVNGLERAPEAFVGMLEGRNFGKLIVRGHA